MSNRRFEMHQYRQIIARMRLGETDRSIARTGLMGRKKAGRVREIAESRGWLNKETSLPEIEQETPKCEQCCKPKQIIFEAV